MRRSISKVNLHSGIAQSKNPTYLPSGALGPFLSDLPKQNVSRKSDYFWTLRRMFSDSSQKENSPENCSLVARANNGSSSCRTVMSISNGTLQQAQNTFSDDRKNGIVSE